MLIEIESQNEICIVRLKGRFVMRTDPEYLGSQANDIKIRNCSKLLIDLGEVSSICSTVIGFIVDLYTSTAKKGEGRFTLTGGNTRVQEVLRITRLNTVIPMAANTAAGLAALRGESTSRSIGR